ncbi:hypothetical protein APHAL10511_002682 [Amanita phalloides]|nr:hypothetical protein APHAL10511_002682 [Amanita phalloides]
MLPTLLRSPHSKAILRRSLATETFSPNPTLDPLPPPKARNSKPRTSLYPHPRPAVSRAHIPLPKLPPTFGKNQLLTVSDSTRALLESVVKDFDAPIRYAFAYGSGVFEQDGYDRPETGAERPMLDFIFAVTHASHFHSINMHQHPSHYPLHARLFGSSYVSSIEDFEPGVWFNAYVPVNGVMIKYGVTTVDNLCSDLLNWRTLYLAGRMHKPLRIIKDDARVRLTQQVNLTSAVRAALLTLPGEFSETQLFERIAGISYSGDPRMWLPAENRGKVTNIVRRQGPQFKELYYRLIVGLPGVHWPSHSSAIEQDTAPQARAAHLKKLPSNLLRRVRETFAHKDPDAQSVFEADESVYWARLAGDERLPDVLQGEMRGIVRYPATMQSLKGLVSVGIGKSARYSPRGVVRKRSSPPKCFATARMVGPPSPLHAAVTRTVAIIKNHTIHHRFDIERRIQEASFEIVKERQMEFDTETDPDTLYELFGDDAASFSEGPVWVYVLERRRAVEVWHTLMGPKDPAVAREEMPNSLRALYGISARQNGVMGSSDAELAEIQIASVFISSPPFPPTELSPDDHDEACDLLDSALRLKLMSDTTSNGTRSSLGGRTSTTSSGKLNANGKPLFRARAIPASMSTPDIVPRTTRAAALRAGQAVEKKDTTPRKPLTKERLKQTFLNVPGHKREETIAVASTAPPTIAPRMTKAACLRTGQAVPSPSPVRRSATDESKAKTFEGVPGHKRRESISVASTKAPAVPPKLNKSAVLRVAHKDATSPPSSFRGSVWSSSGSQTSSRPGSSMASTRRSSSVMSVRSLPAPNGIHATRSKDDMDTPTTPMRRRSSITGPPSIPPRTNKSAELRAAKKGMDTTAAAARNSPRKSPIRSKAPPTSFKPPPTAS